MIKGYKYLVNEEERKRIISLHETRTSEQYLNEDAVTPTKQEIYNLIRGLGFKTANEFMDAYLKKFQTSQAPVQSVPPKAVPNQTKSNETQSVNSTQIKTPVGDQKNMASQGETEV